MSIRAVALRLEGLMQSWGASAAGYDRPTLEAPTHSGVLGIVGAALGIERTDVPSLAGLHRSYLLAVQVVRAGTVGVDYHTALNVPPLGPTSGWKL